MIAPSILIRRSRRENSSLLEIGGYFRGSKGWDASMAWLSNFQLDTVCMRPEFPFAKMAPY